MAPLVPASRPMPPRLSSLVHIIIIIVAASVSLLGASSSGSNIVVAGGRRIINNRDEVPPTIQPLPLPSTTSTNADMTHLTASSHHFNQHRVVASSSSYHTSTTTTPNTKDNVPRTHNVDVTAVLGSGSSDSMNTVHHSHTGSQQQGSKNGLLARIAAASQNKAALTPSSLSDSESSQRVSRNRRNINPFADRPPKKRGGGSSLEQRHYRAGGSSSGRSTTDMRPDQGSSARAGYTDLPSRPFQDTAKSSLSSPRFLNSDSFLDLMTTTSDTNQKRSVFLTPKFLQNRLSKTLVIFPDGRVGSSDQMKPKYGSVTLTSGTNKEGAPFGGLEGTNWYGANSTARYKFMYVMMRSSEFQLYLCMNRRGKVYTAANLSDECYFIEEMHGMDYRLYYHVKYRGDRRLKKDEEPPAEGKPWYLGINKKGRIQKGFRTEKSSKYVQFMPMDESEYKQISDPLKPFPLPLFTTTHAPFLHSKPDRKRPDTTSPDRNRNRNRCPKINLFYIECRKDRRHRHRHGGKKSRRRGQRKKEERRQRGGASRKQKGAADKALRGKGETNLLGLLTLR